MSRKKHINLREKYLMLLRNVLTREIDGNTIDYRHVSEMPSWIKQETELDKAKMAVSSFLADTVSSNSEEHWLEMRRCIKVDRRRIANGSQLHPHAETMVGLKRLKNIEILIRDVCEKNVPGDFVEIGVWRGGQAFMPEHV